MRGTVERRGWCRAGPARQHMLPAGRRAAPLCRSCLTRPYPFSSTRGMGVVLQPESIVAGLASMCLALLR